MLTRSQWRFLSLLALAVPSSAQQTPAIQPCREEQVEVSVANAGVGMSHWAEGIEFLNTSTDTCFLAGRSQARFQRRKAVSVCHLPSVPTATTIFSPRDR